MAKRPAHIENDDDDFDSVELSNDMAAAAAEEEEKRAAAADDDDDDDFELLADDDADDDADADDADAEEEDDDEDEDDVKPSHTAVPKVTRAKAKQTAKERIEELAEKRRTAEAEAFAAEMKLVEETRRREALEERIAALESGKAQPKAVKKPNPDDFKYGEVDSDYVDAMVEFRLAGEREKFQATQNERTQAEENERRKLHYQDRLRKFTEEGNKRFKDYDKIVNSTNFPGDVAVDILDSDQGVDISYYLGKNIGKLRELTLMTPTQRAKAMGRLEERFSARSSAGKKTSNAPATPGRKSTRGKAKGDESKYGPENQDDFDRAFFGR